MADVQPLSFDGSPVSVVTPDIQRLLDLMQAGVPLADDDGLTSDEWATRTGKGRDAMGRIIRQLVKAGQMTVGRRLAWNITGAAVRVPVYAMKK